MLTPKFPQCENKTLILSLTVLGTNHQQGPGRSDYGEIIIQFLHRIFIYSTRIDIFYLENDIAGY